MKGSAHKARTRKLMQHQHGAVRFGAVQGVCLKLKVNTKMVKAPPELGAPSQRHLLKTSDCGTTQQNKKFLCNQRTWTTLATIDLQLLTYYSFLVVASLVCFRSCSCCCCLASNCDNPFQLLSKELTTFACVANHKRFCVVFNCE